MKHFFPHNELNMGFLSLTNTMKTQPFLKNLFFHSLHHLQVLRLSHWYSECGKGNTNGSQESFASLD